MWRPKNRPPLRRKVASTKSTNSRLWTPQRALSRLYRAVSCYRRTMRVHRAPTPLGGPLKLQVRSQYLRSDPMEKVRKIPGTWPADWSDLVSIAPCRYDDQ